MGLFSKDVGIDLGTANTLVYMKGKGIIMREPSVVAVDTKTDEVRCVGAEAKAVIGRTPGSIVAVRPLKDGVIADFDITTNMLENFLKKACGNSMFSRPRVVICIPSGVTEVERRAVREATLKAGARQVSVIEEPMAAAIGAGLPISEQEQRLRTLTLVPHNAAIFKGTVESNLRMAKPDADEAQLWAALEQVNLADFCRSQNGLQTALHEGGSNLSGGQRQRLAMARALLHDTPIYLFDEATSNVDAESENDIMQAIHSLAGKKTIILISHRLANVVHSDCIYAMSNGRVIEQGTHAELLAKQGAYSRLYLAQRQLETLEEEDA